MNTVKKTHPNSSPDRISALPEPLQQHILSFLITKWALQTSILSSSWRHVWTGLTCLELDGLYYSAVRARNDSHNDSIVRKTIEFYDFLDRIFGSLTRLEELKLCVPDNELGFESRLDRWLDRVIGFDLKKLDLQVGNWRMSYSEGPRYSLPKCVLSSKSMTKLRLRKCEMNLPTSTGIQLPSLSELSLGDVYLDDAVLEALLANCMNLEDFYFSDCQGLTRLKVSGLMKLKTVNVMLLSDEVQGIEIDAPNLSDFTYEHDGCCGNESCEIEVSGCKNMKSLELSGVRLDDDDLYAFVENHPALENLSLKKCQFLEYVEISSPRLEYLSFHDCRELVKVKLNTPNLEDFLFHGEDSISLVWTRSSLKLLRLARVYLKPGFGTEIWYSGLVKFLAKLGKSKNLSLDFAVVEDLIIPENVMMKFRPPLYGVKQLEVEVRVSPPHHKAIELIESLLWLAPCPESISIYYNDDSMSFNNVSSHKLLKFKYEKPLKGKKRCGCWKSPSINCWRHSLSEVVLETHERDEDDRKLPYFFPSEALLENEERDVDTELASFFQTARIDGKMVSFFKVTKPKEKWMD